jgi:hypothetical protein
MADVARRPRTAPRCACGCGRRVTTNQRTGEWSLCTRDTKCYHRMKGQLMKAIRAEAAARCHG